MDCYFLNLLHNSHAYEILRQVRLRSPYIRYLEYILLPAAFLMNTEENKLQLVEHGWQNILSNTINIFNIFIPCKRTDDVIPFDQVDN